MNFLNLYLLSFFHFYLPYGTFILHGHPSLWITSNIRRMMKLKERKQFDATNDSRYFDMYKILKKFIAVAFRREK